MEGKSQWLERRRSLKEWRNAIKDAGGKLSFTDVETRRLAPKDFGEPMVQDVDLDGIMCDIYKKGHRIFIHQKG